MTTILFGIANCDTIKKAKKWLNEAGVTYQFHDFRKDGLDAKWLEQAEAALGWETLLNKRGTTYRQLDDDAKSNLDREKVLDLLDAYPAMIKRPVLQRDNAFYCGFSAASYQQVFS